MNTETSTTPTVKVVSLRGHESRHMMRLNACRSAVLWIDVPDDLSTISAFLKTHGLVLAPSAIMRFARRAWNANGQRYNSPRLYEGRNRFPVLYPKTVLKNVLAQAKADSVAGHARAKAFIESFFSAANLN